MGTKVSAGRLDCASGNRVRQVRDCRLVHMNIRSCHAPPSYILDTQRHKVEVTETTTSRLSRHLYHWKISTPRSVRTLSYTRSSVMRILQKSCKQVKFGVYTVGTITSGKVQIEPDTLVGVSWEWMKMDLPILNSSCLRVPIM